MLRTTRFFLYYLNYSQKNHVVTLLGKCANLFLLPTNYNSVLHCKNSLIGITSEGGAELVLIFSVWTISLTFSFRTHIFLFAISKAVDFILSSSPKINETKGSGN